MPKYVMSTGASAQSHVTSTRSRSSSRTRRAERCRRSPLARSPARNRARYRPRLRRRRSSSSALRSRACVRAAPACGSTAEFAEVCKVAQRASDVVAQHAAGEDLIEEVVHLVPRRAGIALVDAFLRLELLARLSVSRVHCFVLLFLCWIHDRSRSMVSAAAALPFGSACA